MEMAAEATAWAGVDCASTALAIPASVPNTAKPATAMGRDRKAMTPKAAPNIAASTTSVMTRASLSLVPNKPMANSSKARGVRSTNLPLMDTMSDGKPPKMPA